MKRCPIGLPHRLILNIRYMSNFPVEVKKQDSGVRFVLLPRDSVQTVTFMVLVGVGSRYEKENQNGLSHFLEHMFFKGTETRPTTKEIVEAIDNVGGEFNAFTGEEYTGYYVKVASPHLQTAADVVSDILLRPLFPAEEIERERGVIIEEIRMYTDMPMRHIHHLWQKAMFGDHPLGRRIDGTEEAVSTFTRDSFVDYVKEHYHSENAIVIVSGNFDVDKTTTLLEELFEPLTQGTETTPTPAPTNVPDSRFIHEKRPSLDQSHMMVGVPGLSLTDEDRWAAELLAVVLGGGMSSRMFLQVRERHGLAYAVRTSTDSYVDAGSFVTQAGVRTDKALEAMKMILAEYDKVVDTPIPEAELNKAKEIVRGNLVLDLEETNSLAMFVGGQELLKKEVLTPEEISERISAVTVEDVQKVAKRLLDPSLRSGVLLSPHEDVSEFEALFAKA